MKLTIFISVFVLIFSKNGFSQSACIYVLNDSNVHSITLTISPQFKLFAVSVKLKEANIREFEELTTKCLGEILTIKKKHKVLLSAKAFVPVSSGIISLGEFASKKEALAYFKKIIAL